MVGHIGSGCGRRVLPLPSGSTLRRPVPKPSAVLLGVLLFVPRQHSPRLKTNWRRRELTLISQRHQKQCGPDCRTKLAAEAAATADVNAARRELLLTEKTATTDSPLQAPPTWLLPTALDLVAFMAIWTGLSGRGSGQARMPVRVKRRAAKRKPSPRKTTDADAQAEALLRRPANNNANAA